MVTIHSYKVLGINKEQASEVIDYGVSMVGAPLEWKETEGAGIKVGIIDTGIDLSHPDLKDSIKETVCFVDGVTVNDDNGHGTHVAGVVAARHNGFGIIGVAPKAELYIARAFDKNGGATDEAIYKSLQWMIDKKVDVINMSFSGMGAGERYKRIIKDAYNRGITLVCAAGNDGSPIIGDNIGYPASFEECIAVTAVDMNKKRASFSSEGVQAEVAAAGVNVYSTYLKGEYATLSGTSMATPVITGAVAILQAKAVARLKRRLTPAEVRLLLNIYSDDFGPAGRDRQYGFGVFSFGRIDGNEIKDEKISYIPVDAEVKSEFETEVVSALASTASLQRVSDISSKIKAIWDNDADKAVILLVLLLIILQFLD